MVEAGDGSVAGSAKERNQHLTMVLERACPPTIEGPPHTDCLSRAAASKMRRRDRPDAPPASLRDDIWLLASLAALALLIHLLRPRPLRLLSRRALLRRLWAAPGLGLRRPHAVHRGGGGGRADRARRIAVRVAAFPALAHAGLVLTAGLTTRALGGSRFERRGSRRWRRWRRRSISGALRSST